MTTILVVDDDPGFRKLLETVLAADGYRVEKASCVSEAVRIGAQKKFDLVLSDLKLPDGDGLAILRRFAETAPQTPFVMITAFGTVPTAVEAMKLGAVDFLEKPLRSPDELRRLVRRALEQKAAAPGEGAAAPSGGPFGCSGLLARDPVMLEVLALARKVAPTNANVLLLGESGTGKELLARCIHQNSQRAGRVFLALNCAALAPTLIESALFGHEKGAFTGAVAQQQGVFERADGGTLFLDEIGDLDGNLQAKLLRVLQERSFERLGGAKVLSVDVRLIAATNRDLKRAVAEGKFRDDLYYRLNTFPLEIPPLRNRPADIPEMAPVFLARAARNLGKKEPVLSSAAVDVLVRYSWPGNVRELENLMERVAILCDAEVTPEDLPLAQTESTQPVRWKEIERHAIRDALQRHHGNRTKAARELGISLRTFQYRLKDYGLR
ncbi:MAG: sigma-54 dependent transcriptional regulator [Acidobacteriota bacterium]